MASTLITAYLGAGLAVNRPVTPLIASGSSAIYFATDTNHVYMWSGPIATGSWALII